MPPLGFDPRRWASSTNVQRTNVGPPLRGYYNAVAFHEAAAKAGLPAYSLNGDAFSDSLKEEALRLIQEKLGGVDLVIYSLAAPRRIHPKTGVVHQSVLKPTGEPFTSKTIDLNTGQISEITLEPASGREVADTIEVMGGEDFAMWIDALLRADLLAPGARAAAFSYIGPELTHPVYRDGSIGEAKRHLELTAQNLRKRLEEAIDGAAYVSVNKAVVTQASAAIPVVPLYLSILYPVMEERGVHEAPIDQMNRLLRDHLAPGRQPQLDEEGRIRLDDKELRPDVQAEVLRRWEQITTETLDQLADFRRFQREFRQLFGFEVEGVDYTQPVEVDLRLPENG
ncbi:MAG: enoyl-[acyl-carrier-protein] reductase [NADH] [Candidatus Poribacteria bacterium]|nr:MAG: enoyl-[acyl-carrier-protein] reductase [NADH] [Candidatus Poribacteria bacterium]